MIRGCVHCGKDFSAIGQHSGRYCSAACKEETARVREELRQRHRHPVQEKSCTVCGSSFMGYKNSSLDCYCSSECTKKGRRARQNIEYHRRHPSARKQGQKTPCVVCGTEFILTNGKQNTCSAACRKKRNLATGKASYRLRHPAQERTCVVCDTSFYSETGKGKGAPSITCSLACKVEQQLRYKRDNYRLKMRAIETVQSNFPGLLEASFQPTKNMQEFGGNFRNGMGTAALHCVQIIDGGTKGLQKTMDKNWNPSSYGPERKCVVCSGAFHERQANARTCSTECSRVFAKNEAHRINKAKSRIAAGHPVDGPIIRECKNCGGTFEQKQTHGGQFYCSKKCHREFMNARRREARKEFSRRHPVSCEACGALFTQTHHNQKLCSPLCYRAHQNAERLRKYRGIPRVLACATCGTKFVPRGNQKTCSHKCSQEYRGKSETRRAPSIPRKRRLAGTIQKQSTAKPGSPQWQNLSLTT